jgi:hypothetical protein
MFGDVLSWRDVVVEAVVALDEAGGEDVVAEGEVED